MEEKEIPTLHSRGDDAHEFLESYFGGKASETEDGAEFTIEFKVDESREEEI